MAKVLGVKRIEPGQDLNKRVRVNQIVQGRGPASSGGSGLTAAQLAKLNATETTTQLNTRYIDNFTSSDNANKALTYTQSKSLYNTLISHSISGHADVSLAGATPASGVVLAWNGTNSQWEESDVAFAGNF